MEGISEALLQFFVELVFETVEEIVGGLVEYIFSSDLSQFLNRNLPFTASFSDEITTLDILNQNKETFTK
jgi:hypothetical protein